MNLKELGQVANAIARSKGFYNEAPRIAERLALIHSEVSEALEAFRDDDMLMHRREDGKPDGFPVELADIIIRVVDLANYMGYDLDVCVEAKMAYNKTRPIGHGRVRL